MENREMISVAYPETVRKLSELTDMGYFDDLFAASSILAHLFYVTKEVALDDLVEYRLTVKRLTKGLNDSLDKAMEDHNATN